jgi:hypothetical protein
MARKKDSRRPGKWDRAAKKEFEDMDPEWQQDWADLRSRVMDR